VPEKIRRHQFQAIHISTVFESPPSTSYLLRISHSQFRFRKRYRLYIPTQRTFSARKNTEFNPLWCQWFWWLGIGL